MSIKLRVLIGVGVAVLLGTAVTYQFLKAKTQLECQVMWGKARVMGAKRCQIFSDPAGEPALIKIMNAKNAGSFSNSNFLVKINGSDLSALKGLELRFFSKEKSIGTYSLPIFAEPTLNILRDEIETTLSINWSSLTNKSEDSPVANIDSVQLYLVTAKDTNLNLDISSVSWLDKPKTGRVSLTFDDGYQDHFKAGEILAKSGLVGTAYIITDALNTPNYLTTDQVQNLKKWGWELGSHLVTPVTDLEANELKLHITNTIDKLKKMGSNGDEKQFAFPLGQYSLRDLNIISQSLASARLASGGVESLPPQEVFRLRTVNVTPHLSSQDLLKLAEDAVANGDWLILMFHYLDRPEKGDLNYSLNDFSDLAKKLSGIKSNVKTVGNVLRENKLIP